MYDLNVDLRTIELTLVLSDQTAPSSSAVAPIMLSDTSWKQLAHCCPLQSERQTYNKRINAFMHEECIIYYKLC